MARAMHANAVFTSDAHALGPSHAPFKRAHAQVARMLPGPAGKLQELQAAGRLDTATPEALGLSSAGGDEVRRGAGRQGAAARFSQCLPCGRCHLAGMPPRPQPAGVCAVQGCKPPRMRRAFLRPLQAVQAGDSGRDALFVSATWRAALAFNGAQGAGQGALTSVKDARGAGPGKLPRVRGSLGGQTGGGERCTTSVEGVAWPCSTACTAFDAVGWGLVAVIGHRCSCLTLDPNRRLQMLVIVADLKASGSRGAFAKVKVRAFFRQPKLICLCVAASCTSGGGCMQHLAPLDMWLMHECLSTVNPRSQSVCNCSFLPPQDPTGAVGAAVHQTLVEREPALSPGAALLLAGVPVFSPVAGVTYLVLVPANVVKVRISTSITQRACNGRGPGQPRPQPSERNGWSRSWA